MRGNPWMRIATTVGAMLIVLLLATSWRFLQSRGVFTSVEEKTSGTCRTVPKIGAVADIAPGNLGWAIIAAGDGLYRYGNAKAERISGTPKDFRVVAMATSGNTLHVLFRQGETSKVSVFKLRSSPETHDVPLAGEALPVTGMAPSGVEEVGRLSTDVFSDPADLVSVDGERFYLVNRHGTGTALGRWPDDVFLLPRANILYFDGMKFVTVAERLNSPAGLSLSRDGGRLFVAEDYPRSLATFTRNDMVGSLEDPALLSLPANPRKISLAPDGSLIVAARPKAGAGQVWRVPLRDGAPHKAELRYSRMGENVTAAAELNGHLLIGTESGLLDCAP